MLDLHRTMIMAGVGLRTGGRKQHRHGQHGRCEQEAREVRQASHHLQLITSRARDAERALDKGSYCGKVKGERPTAGGAARPRPIANVKSITGARHSRQADDLVQRPLGIAAARRRTR